MPKSMRSEKSAQISLISSLGRTLSPETVQYTEFDVIEDKVDFSEILTFAAGEYECPISIIVNNVLDVYQQTKRGKSKVREKNIPLVKTISSMTEVASPKQILPVLESTLVITACHDIQNRLVEISMHKYRHCTIPRTLMLLLNHILPKYTKLNKFNIKDCAIDKYTIYELKNTLCRTKITEISLDSTFLPEGNYDILLEETTCLKYLSLSRCKINDDVCERIFRHLDWSKPAGQLLLTLNLSSNRITDVGAKFIGEVLRKNRNLRYLNLADNRITDDGAAHIFDVLAAFPLTEDEIIDKRTQYLRYLQRKSGIYDKCLQEFEDTGLNKSHRESLTKKSPKKKKGSVYPKMDTPSTVDMTKDKVEFVTLQLIGPFRHPFDKSQMTMKENHSHCIGNLTLAYLSLAYNNLAYPSLKKLLTVLENQREYIKNDVYGLTNMVLDGNNLPSRCIELSSINDILSGRIIRHYAEARSSGRRTSLKGLEKRLIKKSSVSVKSTSSH